MKIPWWNKKVGDEITIIVNGKRITGTIQSAEVKVLKILNPRGVVIDIPTTGEIELG